MTTTVEYVHSLEAIREAAKALLAKIDVMNTEDFAHGGEEKEREALRVALAKDAEL